MDIFLSPSHQHFIKTQIEKGNYTDAQEVINAALKLLEERESRLDEIRQKNTVETEQIFQGKVTDDEMIFATQLSSGKKVLVPLNEEEDLQQFWQAINEHFLAAVWDNTEDDIYAELLQE